MPRTPSTPTAGAVSSDPGEKGGLEPALDRRRHVTAGTSEWTRRPLRRGAHRTGLGKPVTASLLSAPARRAGSPTAGHAPACSLVPPPTASSPAPRQHGRYAGWSNSDHQASRLPPASPATCPRVRSLCRARSARTCTPAARAQLAHAVEPYATCLTDAEWAIAEAFLPPRTVAVSAARRRPARPHSRGRSRGRRRPRPRPRRTGRSRR